MKFIGKLLVITMLFSFSQLTFATTQNNVPPGPATKAIPSWLGTMEASLMTTRIPAQARATVTAVGHDGSWLSWMGWLVAAACLLILGTLHLRIRHQRKTMMRDGEPDFFFLPPARNRRRRTR